MILGYCSREKEIRQSLRLGHWPHASSQDLIEHVEGCRVCTELILVSKTLQEARARSMHSGGQNAPGLVSPGLLWWKAQLRRRNEAVKRIGRPLMGAQIFALVVNVLILVGVIATQAQRGAQWLESLPHLGVLHLETLWSWNPHMPEWSVSWNSGLWMPCAAILVLLSGVVVYLAAERP